MRLLLIAFGSTLLLAATIAPPLVSKASAEEGCTGDNCPPSQSQGGHECEREKKDQTVS